MKSFFGALTRGSRKRDLDVKIDSDIASKLDKILSKLRDCLAQRSLLSIAVPNNPLKRLDNRACRDFCDAVRSTGDAFEKSLQKNSDPNVLISVIINILEGSASLFSGLLCDQTSSAVASDSVGRTLSLEVNQLPSFLSRLIADLLESAEYVLESGSQELMESMLGALFSTQQSPHDRVANHNRARHLVGLISSNEVIRTHMIRDTHYGLPADKARYWATKYDKPAVLKAIEAPPVIDTMSSGDPFDSNPATPTSTNRLYLDMAFQQDDNAGPLSLPSPDDDNGGGKSRPRRRQPPESPSALSPLSQTRSPLEHKGSYISPPASPTVSEMSDRPTGGFFDLEQSSEQVPAKVPRSQMRKAATNSKEAQRIIGKHFDSDALDDIPYLEDSLEKSADRLSVSIDGESAVADTRTVNDRSPPSSLSPLSKVGRRRKPQLQPLQNDTREQLPSTSSRAEAVDSQRPGTNRRVISSSPLDVLDREEITLDDLKRAFDSCPRSSDGTVATSALTKNLRWSQGVPALADMIASMKADADSMSWTELQRVSAPYIRIVSPDGSKVDQSKRTQPKVQAADNDYLNDSMESLEMEKLSFSPSKPTKSSSRIPSDAAVAAVSKRHSPVLSPVSTISGTTSVDSDRKNINSISGLDVIASKSSPRALSNGLLPGASGLSGEGLFSSLTDDAKGGRGRRGRDGPNSSKEAEKASIDTAEGALAALHLLGRQGANAPSPTSDLDISIHGYVAAQLKEPASPLSIKRRASTHSSPSDESSGAEAKHMEPRQKHWAMTGDYFDSSMESEIVPSRPSDVVDSLADKRLDSPKQYNNKLTVSVDLDTSWDDDGIDPEKNASTSSPIRAPSPMSKSDDNIFIKPTPQQTQDPKALKKNMFSLTALDVSVSDADSVPTSPDNCAGGEVSRSVDSGDRAAPSDLKKSRSISADNIPTLDSNPTLSPLVRSSKNKNQFFFEEKQMKDASNNDQSASTLQDFIEKSKSPLTMAETNTDQRHSTFLSESTKNRNELDEVPSKAGAELSSEISSKRAEVQPTQKAATDANIITEVVSCVEESYSGEPFEETKRPHPNVAPGVRRAAMLPPQKEEKSKSNASVPLVTGPSPGNPGAANNPDTKEKKEKFSWFRSVGTKATSFLGRRSRSFDEEASEVTKDSGLFSTDSGLALDPTGSQSIDARKQSPHPSEPLINAEASAELLTEQDILNEIRKDINSAKFKINEDDIFEDGNIAVKRHDLSELLSDTGPIPTSAMTLTTTVPESVHTEMLENVPNFHIEVADDVPHVAIPNPPSHPPPISAHILATNHSSTPSPNEMEDDLYDFEPYSIDTSGLKLSEYPALIPPDAPMQASVIEAETTEIAPAGPVQVDTSTAISDVDQKSSSPRRHKNSRQVIVRESHIGVESVSHNPENDQKLQDIPAARRDRESTPDFVLSEPSHVQVAESEPKWGPGMISNIDSDKDYSDTSSENRGRKLLELYKSKHLGHAGSIKKRSEPHTKYGPLSRDSVWGQQFPGPTSNTAVPLETRSPVLGLTSGSPPTQTSQKFHRDFGGYNSDNRLPSEGIHHPHRPTLISSGSAQRLATTGTSVFGFADTMEIPNSVTLNFREDSNSSFLSPLSNNARKASSPEREDSVSTSSYMSSPWLHTLRGRERESIAPVCSEATRRPKGAAPAHLSQNRRNHPAYVRATETDSIEKDFENEKLARRVSIGKLLSAYVDQIRLQRRQASVQTENQGPNADRSASTWSFSQSIRDASLYPRWSSLRTHELSAVLSAPQASKSVDFAAISSNKLNQKPASTFSGNVESIVNTIAEQQHSSRHDLRMGNSKEEIMNYIDKMASELETRASKSERIESPRYSTLNSSIGPQSSMEKVLLRSMSANKNPSKLRSGLSPK